jgi:glutathione peroxidase-family protein
MRNMHDFEMESTTGETVSLSDCSRKVCLVVNLASLSRTALTDTV